MLSVPEAARRLNVSIDTVRRAIHRGELPAVKLFGRWRVSQLDLARLLAGHVGDEPKAHQGGTG